LDIIYAIQQDLNSNTKFGLNSGLKFRAFSTRGVTGAVPETVRFILREKRLALQGIEKNNGNLFDQSHQRFFI
jgi:hypothetical protein